MSRSVEVRYAFGLSPNGMKTARGPSRDPVEALASLQTFERTIGRGTTMPCKKLVHKCNSRLRP